MLQSPKTWQKLTVDVRILESTPKDELALHLSYRDGLHGVVRVNATIWLQRFQERKQLEYLQALGFEHMSKSAAQKLIEDLLLGRF